MDRPIGSVRHDRRVPPFILRHDTDKRGCDSVRTRVHREEEAAAENKQKPAQCSLSGACQ